jgi:hypothetical protein
MPIAHREKLFSPRRISEQAFIWLSKLCKILVEEFGSLSGVENICKHWLGLWLPRVSIDRVSFSACHCTNVAAAASGPQTGSGVGAIAPAGDSNQNRSVDFIGIPNTDETDLSPLGLDLGEFLTEDNLDFLAGLVGTSQSIFDMPVQGY